MTAADLKTRLKNWTPPDIPADEVPRGANARVFPAAVVAIRGGGFRTGYRDD